VLYPTAADALAALAEHRDARLSWRSPRALTVSGHALVVTQTASDDIPGRTARRCGDRVFVSTNEHDTTSRVGYGLNGASRVRGRVLIDVVVSSAGADFTTTEFATLRTLASTAATRHARLDAAFVRPSRCRADRRSPRVTSRVTRPAQPGQAPLSRSVRVATIGGCARPTRAG